MKKNILIILFLCSVVPLMSQDEYEHKPANDEVPAEKKIDVESLKTDSISIDNPQPEDKSTITVKSQKTKAPSNAPSIRKEPSEFLRNLRLGGGFNLSSVYYNSAAYQSQLMVVGVSPQLTYVMNDYFEGGISFSYNYMGSFGDLNIHSFSFGPILRAYPFESIFLQIEGIFFQNHTIFRGTDYKSQNINAILGGGVISRFSENSYIITGIGINLIKNEYTYNQIIPSPFTSVHFGLTK